MSLASSGSRACHASLCAGDKNVGEGPPAWSYPLHMTHLPPPHPFSLFRSWSPAFPQPRVHSRLLHFAPLLFGLDGELGRRPAISVGLEHPQPWSRRPTAIELHTEAAVLQVRTLPTGGHDPYLSYSRHRRALVRPCAGALPCLSRRCVKLHVSLFHADATYRP